MNYRLLRPVLFALPAETAHVVALNLLKMCYRPWLVKRLRGKDLQKNISIMGLTFPNPVGLAAGLDKNGDYIDALFGLGFGFIEVGAVTPKPQPGNPKPRLFRLPTEHALINRMGFNNKGVDYLVRRLRARRVDGIVGVNLGKNKDTPLNKAVDDYDYCYSKVYPYADYAVINISSPNTPELRDLHSPEYLHHLLQHMKRTQDSLCKQYQRYVPLLVKLSIDTSQSQLEEVVALLKLHEIDGVLTSNTTMDRKAVAEISLAAEAGGLSGDPIFAAAKQMVATLRSELGKEVPIIGIGGIDSPTKAYEMFDAGANLIQFYTGLIYQGPGLPRRIINL